MERRVGRYIELGLEPRLRWRIERSNLVKIPCLLWLICRHAYVDRKTHPRICSPHRSQRILFHSSIDPTFCVQQHFGSHPIWSYLKLLISSYSSIHRFISRSISPSRPAACLRRAACNTTPRSRCLQTPSSPPHRARATAPRDQPAPACTR